jgi:hypothetical protein
MMKTWTEAMIGIAVNRGAIGGCGGTMATEGTMRMTVLDAG